uniref:Mediator of RNA polymerase II transcription subunit 22 n=1 Tax=Oryza rufipogon TaxID=4529 RepID=A0A0E0QKC4_ORYRU
MSKSGGAAAGPTAAPAAAAVQKQKTLLQKADADVSSLVDNFAALINIARVNDPPVRNTQEAFQMDMRGSRMEQRECWRGLGRKQQEASKSWRHITTHLLCEHHRMNEAF